jgi:hypothetical protein
MDELSKTLKQAYEAVVTAGIPEHLQEVAFSGALKMLSPDAPAFIAPPTVIAPVGSGTGGTATASATTEGTDGAPAVSESEMYDRVVAHTGAARSKIEALVHTDEGVPTISIPGLKLGKNNAEKTRRIAAILTIVRGFGLGENETPVEAVRAEATRLKCYDSANFSSYLAKVEGYVVTGGGQNRRIRAKAPAIAGFPALVDLLIEEA